MKFFIITCLKESQDEVSKILKQANITIFSATDVVGYKDSNHVDLLGGWFASGDEKFDSVLIFSFTPDNNAEQAMALVKAYNLSTETKFPVRAFIVAVEQASF